MENLNKDNFWNEIEQKYPVQFKYFSEWIDNYKESVGWDSLFGNNIDAVHYKQHQIKFHDIPLEMQLGVILRFAGETCDPKIIEGFQLEKAKEYVSAIFGLIKPPLKSDNGKTGKTKRVQKGK